MQTETEGQGTKYSKVIRLVQGWDGFETWETSWSVRRWGSGAEQGGLLNRIVPKMSMPITFQNTVGTEEGEEINLKGE